MEDWVILAAGRSSRFGRDKLNEEFLGRTLPEYALSFAISNGAKRIYLTLNKDGVEAGSRTVYHPVLDRLQRSIEDCWDGPDIRVAFQDKDSYGPGAALMTWSGQIQNQFTVLFGDNLYLPTEESGSLIQQFKLHEGEVFFTSKKNQPCARNLQLAYVTPVMEMPDYQSFLIEKPHSFYSGEFFCGFVSFGPNFFQRVGELRKSDRGEIELSDMINGQQTRTHAPIDLYTHSWADLTYDSDVQNIRRAISEWKFGG